MTAAPGLSLKFGTTPCRRTAHISQAARATGTVSDHRDRTCRAGDGARLVARRLSHTRLRPSGAAEILGQRPVHKFRDVTPSLHQPRPQQNLLSVLRPSEVAEWAVI